MGPVFVFLSWANRSFSVRACNLPCGNSVKRVKCFPAPNAMSDLDPVVQYHTLHCLHDGTLMTEDCNEVQTTHLHQRRPNDFRQSYFKVKELWITTQMPKMVSNETILLDHLNTKKGKCTASHWSRHANCGGKNKYPVILDNWNAPMSYWWGCFQNSNFFMNFSVWRFSWCFQS